MVNSRPQSVNHSLIICDSRVKQNTLKYYVFTSIAPSSRLPSHSILGVCTLPVVYFFPLFVISTSMVAENIFWNDTRQTVPSTSVSWERWRAAFIWGFQVSSLPCMCSPSPQLWASQSQCHHCSTGPHSFCVSACQGFTLLLEPHLVFIQAHGLNLGELRSYRLLEILEKDIHEKLQKS